MPAPWMATHRHCGISRAVFVRVSLGPASSGPGQDLQEPAEQQQSEDCGPWGPRQLGYTIRSGGPEFQSSGRRLSRLWFIHNCNCTAQLSILGAAPL